MTKKYPPTAPPLDPTALVAQLLYQSYCAQRQRSPDVLPARWEAIYPQAASFELRYQQEDYLA
jgi:hypothetical protein